MTKTTQVTVKDIFSVRYGFEGQFDGLDDQEITFDALKKITMLLVAGWTFCGMGHGFVELEHSHDDGMSYVNLMTGDITVER